MEEEIADPLSRGLTELSSHINASALTAESKKLGVLIIRSQPRIEINSHHPVHQVWYVSLNSNSECCHHVF